MNIRHHRVALYTALLYPAVIAMAGFGSAMPARAGTAGLDSPPALTSYPLSVAGQDVVTLSANPPTATFTGIVRFNQSVGVLLNGDAPTQALDVNGYVRIRSINNEGGTIQLDGNNGVKSYIENTQGTFRLLDNGWANTLFQVQQNGNTAVSGTLTLTNSGTWNGLQVVAGNHAGYVFDDGNMHIESTGSDPLWINQDSGAPTIIAAGGGGLTVGGNYTPSSALDVNGYVRIRTTNNEGGTIQLDGANGVTTYVENVDGVFRILDTGWSFTRFQIDQTGNGIFNGGVTVGTAGITFGDGTVQTTANKTNASYYETCGGKNPQDCHNNPKTGGQSCPAGQSGTVIFTMSADSDFGGLIVCQ